MSSTPHCAVPSARSHTAASKECMPPARSHAVSKDECSQQGLCQQPFSEQGAMQSGRGGNTRAAQQRGNPPSRAALALHFYGAPLQGSQKRVKKNSTLAACFLGARAPFRSAGHPSCTTSRAATPREGVKKRPYAARPYCHPFMYIGDPHHLWCYKSCPKMRGFVYYSLYVYV